MRKKWLLITAGMLLMLIFGAGCGNKDAGEASPSVSNATPTSSADTAVPSVGAVPSEDGQIMNSYVTLLKMPGNEKALLTFIRQKVSELSPTGADQMILSFEEYQKTAVTEAKILSDALIKMIQTSSEPYNEKTLNDLTKITNADLKIMLQAVFDKGYKIIAPEGMYEAIIDYGVYKVAEKYVSPDIAAYIEIMASESDSRMASDAAIIIPIDEVFSRTLACESFIKTYPASVKADQVKQKFSIYVDACFFGQNNTPAFDYSTDKLIQEFQDSYDKAVQSGKDSAVIKAAADYLKVLKDNDYTLTTAVTEYRKNMTDGLKNSMP